MKNYFNKLKTMKGWPKLYLLFRILTYILFVTTIGQLFYAKEVSFGEVVSNSISGKYTIGQYLSYGLYVVAKMLLIMLPTIGAALLIRLIRYKDTLKGKFLKIISNAGLVISLLFGIAFVFVIYLFKIWFEGGHIPLNPNRSIAVWEEIFQLYDIVLPALVLTFMDTTFSEIIDAKKVEKGKKLSNDVENEIVKIFSDERLTDNEKQHLLRNLKNQTKSYLEKKTKTLTTGLLR